MRSTLMRKMEIGFQLSTHPPPAAITAPLSSAHLTHTLSYTFLHYFPTAFVIAARGASLRV